ncbi:endonuclease/exonuclease/phosphatase family protein [Sphingobacterium alkalisoli]|uniref:Endonuclease/exonuclease/phosphatase family protein n=1 Tax=Sphingobacterium alkalisoli TaxID=1874115 RepID=A0A4U0GYY0_9SPHI|nr:endonuclease/exonuclease/phosphatase family protein [Sphingobacterium alkalisoli]TJY64447.1 endonuclease/exonuclease/phosphatase family protein [Sphingobacterium alkalisoli]GGH21707.1 endonuclease [Sphingobacterium alkalisoli]
MKHFLLTSFFILFAVCAFAQEINVASFNIRLKTDGDVGNLWQDRKEAVCNLISYHEFDIFGIQEGFSDQVKDMQQLLPNFDYVGVGRDDGAEKGEHSAIFYNKTRFDVIKSGTFWLSATDTEKPNKGWDAALPRICTWGIFKDKESNKSFILMNTHFDHVGVQARKESAKLILSKATEFATELPLILTGDFNVDETNEAYFTLANSGVVEDALTKSKIVYTPNSTFNNWGKSIKPSGRIDHIFITPHFNVEKYGILTDTYIGKYPSDHFPVAARLMWR